jgi:uncharacterized membrane protein
MLPSQLGLLVLALMLGALGWVDSLYFRLHHRALIPEKVWWMPKVLQMTDCRCDEIVDTRFGRTLGRSNAWWGLWYYPILMVMLVGNWFFNIPSTGLFLIVTLLAFAHSFYLAWGLYVLRVLCRPCLAAHIVNTAIFVIILIRAFPLLLAR